MRISAGSIQQLDKTKPRNKCKRWRLCVHVDGKRRSKRFSGSVSAAKQALEEWRGELAQTPASGLTFAQYAAQWLDLRQQAGQLRPATLRNDAGAVKALTASPLGPMPLGSITMDDCERALLWCRDHPRAAWRERLSGSSLRALFVKMREIFKHAELSDAIAKNPTRRMKAPKSDTKEKTALSPLEIELLLNRIDGEPVRGELVAVYLMLCLGLRRGETLGLLVSDMRGGVAHVCRSMSAATGKIEPPKTAAGVRSLPIPARLAAKLQEWQQIRDSWGIGDAPTVVCDPCGRAISPDALAHWWVRNRAALGCDGLTLHQLRHSNLSMMARVMPSAFDLQKWAGWSDIGPAKTYVHTDLDALTAAAGAVLPAPKRAKNAPGANIDAGTDGLTHYHE